MSFLVYNPSVSKIPHVLGPGESWTGVILQNTELESMSRDGYLYCGIYHSASKRPVLRRVTVKNMGSIS